jgi:P pilus assembly chaperone PapD
MAYDQVCRRYVGAVRRNASRALLALGLLAIAAAPARAELILSQVIVDLTPDQPARQDIELWNNSNERMYVVAEAAEIVAPGLAAEQRLAEPDPEKLGLLVTPNRLILEPGQRRLVRVSAIGARGDRDRIYRVAIKPVVGGLEAEKSALKILLGYDALVIVRPAVPAFDVSATRSGNAITFKNEGNTNAELFDGRQCDEQAKVCTELPPKRLYAGATWEQSLPGTAVVEYSVKAGSKVVRKRF